MKQLLPLLILILAFSTAAQTPKDVKPIYFEKCTTDCDKIVIEGVTYYAFEGEDADVMFSFTREGKLYRMTAGVIANKRIDFDPAQAMIAVYKVKTDKMPTEIFALSPEAAAKKADGNRVFKNIMTGMLAGMSRRTVTENSTTNGTVTVNSNDGTVATGTYNGQTTTEKSEPNPAAQQQARQTIDERNRNGAETKNNILGSALRANTIFPDKYVFGEIFFEPAKGEFLWACLRIEKNLYCKGFNIPKD